MADEVDQDDRRSDAGLIARALVVAVVLTVAALVLGAGLLAGRTGTLAQRRVAARARLEASGAELGRQRAEAFPAARRQLEQANPKLTGEALTGWALALLVLDEIAVAAELDEEGHRRAVVELLELAKAGAAMPTRSQLVELVSRAR